VVTIPACWRRGQTLGAERFEKELLDQRPRPICREPSNAWVTQLGARAAEYLRSLADQSDRALPRQIAELNELVRHYGPEAVAQAIDKAAVARAFGSDYICQHPPPAEFTASGRAPVRLKDPRLNELTTDQTLAAGIRRASARRPRKGKIMTLAEKLQRLRLPP